MLKKLSPLLAGLLFIAFPFIIYFGLRYVEPIVFAGVLFFMLVVRTLVMPSDNKLGKYLMVTVASLYCIAIALFDSESLLRYYPVIISLYVGLLFFLSLFDKETLIERFAKLSGKPYPDGARVYMRVLTQLWVLVLVLNAFMAAYTACCTSGQFWLLYNGFISYVIILGLIFGEIIFRQFYKRKHFPGWD